MPPESRHQKNSFSAQHKTKPRCWNQQYPTKQEWPFLVIVSILLGRTALKVDFVSFCRSAKFHCWQGKKSSIISQDILAPSCHLEHWGANATSRAKMHSPRVCHCIQMGSVLTSWFLPEGCPSQQKKLSLLLRGKRMDWVLHSCILKQGNKLSVNASS